MANRAGAGSACLTLVNPKIRSVRCGRYDIAITGETNSSDNRLSIVQSYRRGHQSGLASQLKNARHGLDLLRKIKKAIGLLHDKQAF